MNPHNVYIASQLYGCWYPHSGLSDVDQVCISDMFLFISQGDKATIGNFELSSIEFIA